MVKYDFVMICCHFSTTAQRVYLHLLKSLLVEAEVYDKKKYLKVITKEQNVTNYENYEYNILHKVA